MLRETKQSQGTVVLFLWFAFLNSQIVFLVLLFLFWKMNSPAVPLSEAMFWNPALANDPLVLVLLVMAMTTAGLGLGLGFRYFAAVRTAAETAGAPKVENTLYVLALVLCEMTGLYGILIGFVKGPVTLAVPFVLVGMALIGVLFPSGRRFPKPR